VIKLSKSPVVGNRFGGSPVRSPLNGLTKKTIYVAPKPDIKKVMSPARKLNHSKQNQTNEVSELKFELDQVKNKFTEY
jgi:hypothetical protein